MKVYSTLDSIYGKSYDQWIVDWWNQKQPKKHVFLLFADYDGTMPSTVKIPRGRRALLMSPINYISIMREEDSLVDLVLRATSEIDIIDKNKIKVQFDGEEIGHLATRALAGIFQTVNGTAFSDGYWLFMKGPFAPGKHTLSSFGTCRSGEIRLSATTDLVVV